ncbi:MAG TPA: response regulator [Anaeromyxobacteraceae bacterium]|nr:response regulator [Anaeromyxobacteraceae bacterium]
MEDSEDVREALTELLELHGHRVVAVATGLGGVEAVAAVSPEVVLVDVGLPDIDGLEVARRIRARHGAGPYLVAMTGYTREQDRREALDAGFDLHLAKPVEIDTLVGVIARGRPV